MMSCCLSVMVWSNLILRRPRLRWSPPSSTRTWRQFRTSQPLQGRRGFILICVWHHSSGHPQGSRAWRQFRITRPPGTARLHCNERMTSLRWASQELTKVATCSQFVAPRDGEASLCPAYDTTPLGLPRVHESGVSFTIRSPREGTQIGTGPPKRASRKAQDGQEMAGVNVPRTPAKACVNQCMHAGAFYGVFSPSKRRLTATFDGGSGRQFSEPDAQGRGVRGEGKPSPLEGTR